MENLLQPKKSAPLGVIRQSSVSLKLPHIKTGALPLNGPLSENANEAAHEALIELIQANPLPGPGLSSPGAGKKIADNVITLHRELAAYYRSLDQEA